MPLRSGPLVVPAAVMKRLPMYYRYLHALVEEGVERLSSQELSARMGISSSQLRQDLNCFGEFGQQGYGYRIVDLYQAMCEILGVEKRYKTVLVGAGNLGQSITNYEGFRRRGLVIVGLFDMDSKIIGEEINGITIYNIRKLADFLEQEKVEVGVITTPAKVAQEVADILAAGGVKGIWNFAPQPVKVPGQVMVENTHIGDGLLNLFYKMKAK